MNTLRFASFFVLFACLAATIAAEKIDTSYFPSDAIGAAVMHPRTLLEDPQNSHWPIEVIVAAGQENLGIDPRDIEVLLATISVSGLAENGNADIGFIAHFRKPIDVKAIVEHLDERVIETEGEGPSQIWKLDFSREGIPANYMASPSPKVLLLTSTKSSMESMMAAKGSDSPAAKLLIDVDTDKTLTGVLDFTAIRPMITEGLKQMPPLPPPFAPFAEAPEMIESLELSVQIADPMSLVLSVSARNKEDAEKLREFAEQAKKLATIFLQQQMQNPNQTEQTATARAMNQYMSRMIRTFFDSIQVETKEERVVVSMEGTISSISTTGILAGLLLPAVQSAREAARRVESMNQLKQIGIALLSYHNVHDKFPTDAIRDKEGKALLSWRVALLPYIDEQALYDQFHLDEPWDSPHNRKLIDRMPAVFQNPSLADRAKTVFLLVSGQGTGFDGTKEMTMKDITDGLSNSIAAVEVDPDRAVEWTKPEDWKYDVKKPRSGLGKLRPGGFNALFFDGSVQFISNSTDEQVLRAFFTIDGGEPLFAPGR